MANCGAFYLTKAEIHRRVKKALTRRGYTCCETSVKKKTDATRNTPDMFVYADEGRWVGMFFQSKYNKLTEDAQKLVDAGKAYLVRDVEDAVNIMAD